MVDLTGRLLGLAQLTVSKRLACLRECRLAEAARAAEPRSILWPRPDRGPSRNFVKWAMVANSPRPRERCFTVT